MDERAAVENNLWATPEGVYIRLVVFRGCDGGEKLVVEGLDLVFYSCEKIPLRDNRSIVNFFKNLGYNIELIYGETSRVKIFRTRADYNELVNKILSAAERREAPSWAAT